MQNDKDEIKIKRRGGVWLAVLLFFLAPLVGEFLLGNLSITWLWALMVLAPLYGGGAILIRETARRFGLGWPSILLFGLAYAVIEEAFVTQSLFNPDYVGLRLLDYGYMESLGIGSWWTVFVLSIHVIWSTATPIALVEALSGERRHSPWLGNVGLAVVAIVFLFGCYGSSMSPGEVVFRATTAQFVVSGIVVVILCGLAFAAKRFETAVDGSRTCPSARAVGMLGFAFGSVYILAATRPEVVPAWLHVLVLLAILVCSACFVWRWSQAAAWSDRHEVALAGGYLFTYAWFGFVQQPSVGEIPMWLDLLGNAVFALAAVALFLVLWKRVNAGERLVARRGN